MIWASSKINKQIELLKRERYAAAVEQLWSERKEQSDHGKELRRQIQAQLQERRAKFGVA